MRGMKRCLLFGWALLLTILLSSSSQAVVLIPMFSNWGLEGPHPNDPYQAGNTVFYSLAMGGTRSNPTQDNTQQVKIYLSRVQNSTASPAVLLPPGVFADIPGSQTAGPEVHGSGTIPSTFGGIPITSGTYYIVFSATGTTGSDTKSSQITIAVPDISVEQPAGTALTDNSSTVSFPETTVNGASSDTFVIRDPGTAGLTGVGATINGTNSADFTVTTAPATSIPAGNSAGMVVQFSPKAVGTRTASLHIASNVSGTKNPFDITLSGVGVAAPLATTGGPSNVTSTTATLSGTANAQGTTTTTSFDYGPTTSYGSSAVASPSSVTGSSDTAVSAALSALTPGATYHYRLSATSVGGTTRGSDGQFTTAAAPVPALPRWGYLVLFALTLFVGAFGVRFAR